MYAKLHGATLHGIDGCITVEGRHITICRSLMNVGLPNQSVKEAQNECERPLKIGYEFPMRRIVVNLAPATIRKSKAGPDLAIALGVLFASGQINGRKLIFSALFE